MVGREIDDDRFAAAGIEGLDIRCRLVVGQRQHDRIGRLRSDGRGIEQHIAQLAVVALDMIGHALAFELARGNEAELEARMGAGQADQFGAGMPARADQSDRPARHGATPAGLASVAGRERHSSTQASISAKRSMPYQNTFQSTIL